MGYIEEELEVEEFLKDCTLTDFLFVITKLFRDKYPNFRSFGYYIAEEISNSISDNIKTYIEKPKYRKDIQELIWEYDLEDPEVLHIYHLKSLEIKFTNEENLLENKEEILKALESKSIDIIGSKITVHESAIDFIEIESNRFYLKVNEERIIKYQVKWK